MMAHPGVLNAIKLRMPTGRNPAVRLWVIRSMVERERAQTASKGPKILAKWKRMWGRTDS